MNSVDFNPNVMIEDEYGNLIPVQDTSISMEEYEEETGKYFHEFAEDME